MNAIATMQKRMDTQEATMQKRMDTLEKQEGPRGPRGYTGEQGPQGGTGPSGTSASRMCQTGVVKCEKDCGTDPDAGQRQTIKENEFTVEFSPAFTAAPRVDL